MAEKVFYFNEKNLPPIKYVDFEDKNTVHKFLVDTMLNKLHSMFEWQGLPETIPQRVLETMLMRAGSTTIFKWNDRIYQSHGQIGGELNYNYLPRISIVSNPYIKDFNSKTFEIYYGKDDPESIGVINAVDKCVVGLNDPNYMGILPICNYYATLLTENVLSKRIVTINSRAINIFIAPDGNAKKDFEDFITNLTNGKIKAILAKNIMKDSQTLPYAQNSSTGVLTDLIEDQQYIKASWLNELGLNANYNMKRESINSNESQLNQDALLPLVDQMLLMRKNMCEQVNELFGVNWTVDFSSAWKAKRVEIEEAIDAIDQTSQIEVQETEQEESEVEENES